MRRARPLWRSLAQLRLKSEEQVWCPWEAQRVVEETNVTSLPIHDATFLFKYCVDGGVPQDSEVGPIFQMYFLNNAAQFHPHQFETFMQSLAHFGQLRSAFEEPHVIELLPFITGLPPSQLFGCVRALAFADAKVPLKFYQKAAVRVLHAWRKGWIRCDMNACVHLLSIVDAAKTAPIHWREVWALSRRLRRENVWEEFAPQLPTPYILRLLSVFHRVAIEREEMLNERQVFQPLARLGLEACERGRISASEQARVAEAIGFWGSFFPLLPIAPDLPLRHRLSLLWAPLVHGVPDSKWRTEAKMLLAEDASSLETTSSRRKLMLRQVKQECGAKPSGKVAWSNQKGVNNGRISRLVERSNISAVTYAWSFWSKAPCFLAERDSLPLTVDTPSASSRQASEPSSSASNPNARRSASTQTSDPSSTSREASDPSSTSREASDPSTKTSDHSSMDSRHGEASSTSRASDPSSTAAREESNSSNARETLEHGSSAQSEEIVALSLDAPGITGFERIEARHLRRANKKVMFVRSDATLRTLRAIRDDLRRDAR